jgi:hypothetical protein
MIVTFYLCIERLSPIKLRDSRTQQGVQQMSLIQHYVRKFVSVMGYIAGLLWQVIMTLNTNQILVHKCGYLIYCA